MLASLVKNLLRETVPLRHKQKLIRFALANGAEVGFDHLSAKGFKPGAAIDVGAYHGEWTRSFARVFKQIPILMIEAQAEKRPILERVASAVDAPVALETALLSDEAGRETPFFVMETGSSVYPENTSAPRQEITLTTQTLDSVVQRHPELKPPYLLKLDVQGAELDVLRGGAATLRDAEFVMLEVSILEYNAGSPGLREVIEFMSSAGFVIYDITNLIRLPSGDLCQVDAIFIRTVSPLRPTGMLA